MMAYKAVSCIPENLPGSGAIEGRRLDEDGSARISIRARSNPASPKGRIYVCNLPLDAGQTSSLQCGTDHI